MTETPQVPATGDALKPRINPRVIGLLVVLTAVIFASVIVTDLLSPRDRNPSIAATSTARATTSATGAAP